MNVTPLLIIGTCLLAGLLLRRFSSFPDNSADVLNRYVIWIALPALILSTVPSLTLEPTALIPMAVAWIILLVSAFVVIVVSKQLQWANSTRCVLLLLVPLGNTSFVGIPLVSALIGEEGVVYAILYDQLGSFLALSSYGPIVLAIHGDDRVSLKSVGHKIITFPPFIALIVAVLLSFIGMPKNIETAAQSIGATLVPVVMVAVGFQWQFKLPGEDRLPMVFGLVFKLFLAPALAFILLIPFTMDDFIRHTVVLEAGMASMVSAAALAISHGQNPRLASALVGYGILLSLITVPVWFQWLIH
ncbi:AEC family transporter [Pleionea sediminis]|uniref:AEC family transporter n=1 Tax=Pleionea sediminis TaxID=2569479 RepID=UPI00118650ED|nr:AEC family transporter [Pleionea sediminis]